MVGRKTFYSAIETDYLSWVKFMRRSMSNLVKNLNDVTPDLGRRICYRTSWVWVTGYIFIHDSNMKDSYGQRWTYDARQDLKYAGQSIFFISIVVCQIFNIIQSKTRIVSVFHHGCKLVVLSKSSLFCLSFWVKYAFFSPLALNLNDPCPCSAVPVHCPSSVGVVDRIPHVAKCRWWYLSYISYRIAGTKLSFSR